jgi:hypothetical protein
MPSPIPPLPPVTTATRLVRSKSVIGNLYSCAPLSSSSVGHARASCFKTSLPAIYLAVEYPLTQLRVRLGCASPTLLNPLPACGERVEKGRRGVAEPYPELGEGVFDPIGKCCSADPKGEGAAC